MKLTRMMLTAVLSLLILIGAVACSLLTTPSAESKETKIYTYLEEKYPDLEFEIKSYTQDTYTSGKYVFHIFCKTTEIDFQIYQSSFLTTDSYTVTYANMSVEKMLLEFFEESLPATPIKSVQWLDLYEDGNTGYKFREVDLSQIPSRVSDIENIYRIELLSTDTDSTSQAIQDVAKTLSHVKIPCDKISFEWTYDDYAIVFNTNMFTLEQASEEELDAFLSYLNEARPNDAFVTVSYLSRIKYADLYLDEIEDGTVIPGFHDKNSENKPAGNTTQK